MDDKLYELPKGWVWVKIGEIAETIQYGYTAKANFYGIGTKFLRITDIQDNKVIWDKVPYCEISESDKEKYRHPSKSS